MIDFNHVLLRLTVAEVGGDNVPMRIDGLSRDACSFMAANHTAHAARVGNALHVSVELVSGEGVPAETLHHAAFGFSPCTCAAIYQPVDFDHGIVLKAVQKFGNGAVLYRHDKFIEVDDCNPASIETVTLKAVVVGGKLALASGEKVIFHNARVDVGLKHLACAVGALVVVDVEAFHALAAMPLNPLLEVGTLILCNGTHCQVVLGRGVIVLDAPLQLDGIDDAIAQDTAPAVACHLVGNHPGDYLSSYLVHSEWVSKVDFSGNIDSNAARKLPITVS